MQPAEVTVAPQSKTPITAFFQIAGVIACVIGLLVGLWAYSHRPGNVEQVLFRGGWTYNAVPFYVMMALSALLLVAGLVASLKPESNVGRIFLGVPVAAAILLLLLAIIVPAIQAMRGRPATGGVAATDSGGAILTQARKEIEAKLLYLNESWYGYEMNPFGGRPQRLVEMKGLSIKAKANGLDAADKANGIEWRGVIRIECEVYRTVPVTIDRESKAVRVTGTWGEWRNGGERDAAAGNMIGGVPVFVVDPMRAASPMLDLTIRNGRWEWCVNDAQTPDRAIVLNNADAAGVDAAKLIGTWKLGKGATTISVTYSKDHTYFVEMTSPAGARSENGKWNLNGDRLTQKPTKSDMDPNSVGKESTHLIARLDDSTLIVRAGNNSDMTFQRASDALGR